MMLALVSAGHGLGGCYVMHITAGVNLDTVHCYCLLAQTIAAYMLHLFPDSLYGTLLCGQGVLC